MNPQWFGDSFDIVKRFFIANICEMGYQVFIDPMLTGEWNGLENKFYDFLGASPLESLATSNSRTALFLDPDTGITQKLKSTKKHVTVRMLVNYLREHEIVFSFDQSFSRSINTLDQMSVKLSLLKKEGASGFYYDGPHARFLFSAKSQEILVNLKRHLAMTGLPEKRLISQ